MDNRMALFTFLALISLCSPTFAAYQKRWDYNGTNFWDSFNFINGDDSQFTHGFAQYVGIDEALSSGLAKINNSKVRLGVDSTNKYTTTSKGRKSVRLQSWGYFDNGLLIADFNHVPVAGCGMWPAFWIYQGETSSTYSEIDILENVNKQTSNTHSFYTSEPCTVRVQKGSLVETKTTNCHYDETINAPQGCSFYGEQGTFNQPFNDQYRVIALQIESDRMRIWHFKKNEVPTDLSSEKPNPDAWTKAPTVHVTPLSCDFRKAFRAFHIIINITFCGEWAGDDFKDNSNSGQCSAITGTTDCKSWVGSHPSNFANTYFEFNSIKLYEQS